MNPAPDIHDIKGLVPIPGWPWWVWALLALSVLIAAGLFARWWRKRSLPDQAAPLVPPLSPYERACRELQRLRADQLMERGQIEPFYLRLSDIVRRYLEDQFGLRAPERTTEEFLQDVARGGRLSPAHQALLGAFLQESDLVKFARYRPALQDLERALVAAETFVSESGAEPVAAEAMV